MLSELPKLFDRSFTLGHLLPAGLLLAGALTLLVGFGQIASAELTALLEDDLWFGAASVAVAAWLTGLLLVAANRFLIRLREGYLLPARLAALLRRRQQRRFQALCERRETLRRRRREVPEAERGTLERELIRVGTRLAREFPDREAWILPTAFGNILRAFEVYPRLLYGAESVVVWPRLLAIASDTQRRLVDQAKAHVDLWVNLWAVALLLLAEYLGLALVTGSTPLPFLPLGALLALPLASWAARYSALAWGTVVKSTFDIYLPELRERLELPQPASRREERTLWTGYSQAVLFHWPPSLPERTAASPEHRDGQSRR